MRITSTSAGTGFTGTGASPAKERSSVEREREARVAELREQYRSGSYQVDARKVATAILNQHHGYQR